MKDYKKVAEKIRKKAVFCDIHQCGCPTEHTPVNLYFQICEAYVIGFAFYVCYSFGTWSIDYTLDPAVRNRIHMKHISGIKRDRDMYAQVDRIISMIRDKNHITALGSNVQAG